MKVPEYCRDCKSNVAGYEHTRWCDKYDFIIFPEIQSKEYCTAKQLVRIG